MEKYNVEELEEKIKRCKYIKVNETNIDYVDELSGIKISRKSSKEEKILDFISNAEDTITNVIKSLYK